MTTEQRQTNRTLYQQLRIKLTFPGEILGGERKPYTPVNKNHFSWDDAMVCDDTPTVARLRQTYAKTTFFMMGAA